MKLLQYYVGWCGVCGLGLESWPLAPFSVKWETSSMTTNCIMPPKTDIGTAPSNIAVGLGEKSWNGQKFLTPASRGLSEMVASKLRSLRVSVLFQDIVSAENILRTSQADYFAVTTAVFSTCGMGIFVFSVAAVLSMPKQLITVYLGVILAQSNSGNLFFSGSH